MNADRIIFEKKSEHRDWYFVEYSPPIDGFRFASISLLVLQPAEKTKIAAAMESEAQFWLGRYNVPVMVSAFDDKESLIYLDSIKPTSHLLAFRREKLDPPVFSWREIKDAELPDDALDTNKLIKIYHDIDFRTWTSKDRNLVEKKQRQMVLTAWLILFVWLVVIPVTVIILGETSVWMARMVLIYSFWKVFVQVMKLTGKWKKSKREEEKEREEAEKDHHHYHCKKNPEGFMRLKLENFEKETQEGIRKEDQALREKQQ